MDEWWPWNEGVPDDVKGIFIKYEDDFIKIDEYHSDGRRKYRECRPVEWKFIKRSGPTRKTVRPIIKHECDH